MSREPQKLSELLVEYFAGQLVLSKEMIARIEKFGDSEDLEKCRLAVKRLDDIIKDLGQ